MESLFISLTCLFKYFVSEIQKLSTWCYLKSTTYPLISESHILKGKADYRNSHYYYEIVLKFP